MTRRADPPARPRGALPALAVLCLLPVLGLAACEAAPPEEPARGLPSAGGGAPVSRPQAELDPARRDLGRDERLGGHTLARHVGKTDAELRQRLARERRIAAASTYPDRETAERVVGRTLETERETLRKWLAREGSRPNLVLDYRGDGRPVGRTLRRGARTPAPADSAVVVLRWDPRSDDWYVLTSYPEASR